MTQFPTQGATSPQPPWHMWGSSVPVEINIPAPGAAGGLVGPAPAQVARVNYRRPETWSMFFAGELLDGNVSDVDMQIVAQFNLTIGVGRTLFDTQGVFGSSTAFAEFRWSVLAGIRPGTGNVRKWTTQANTPLLDDLTATSRQLMQWFPAQDIQMQVRAALILNAPSAVANRVQLQLTGWVAPRVHVRPDWTRDTPEHLSYLGAETGGT